MTLLFIVGVVVGVLVVTFFISWAYELHKGTHLRIFFLPCKRFEYLR